ncbi:ClpP/crotonase-like domain-containing protein [Radiomyces spectabilis]|uniref:ClpP/crotonase-like domain-containing protein n=1 Tax=Radiomyces spectabilis TaxID=64574 RepID=UPI00222035D2|nr:ClpP/crotonase-like domain-containing protein [Radiomyces spectabilis]KAI8388671.1 ClpP/crotonase-like domain-containing protein [Radiomyces spectabilis]
MATCNPVFSETDSLEITGQKLLQLGEGEVQLTKHYVPGIALIVLHHPKRHNALSGRMMAQLNDIVKQLEQDQGDLVAVIMTGSAGKSFCAGLDLNFAREYLQDLAAAKAMNKFMHSVLSRFARLPLITVASVAGPALGGGTELLTAFDFICMHSQSYIRFVQTRMGVTSPWGGARRLMKQIGRKEALRVMASAPVLYAQEAKEIGLIDVIIPVELSSNRYETCLAACVEFLKPFVTDDHGARVAPDAVRGMKRLLTAADSEEQIEQDMLIFSQSNQSKL